MAITDGLVSYYKLDGDATDVLWTNNGTASNVSWAAGKINNAGSFNGSSAYISVPDSPNLRLTTLTISMWINISWTKSIEQIPLRKDTSWTRHLWGFVVQANTTNIQSQMYNGTQYLSNTYTLSIWTWTNVIMTISWSWWIMNFYVNWTKIWNSVNLWNFTAPTLPLYLSRYHEFSQGWGYFNWLIDEVGIWNRALTQDEITQLYNGGNGMAYPFNIPYGIVNEPTRTRYRNELGQIDAVWAYDLLIYSDSGDRYSEWTKVWTTTNTNSEYGIYWTGTNYMYRAIPWLNSTDDVEIVWTARTASLYDVIFMANSTWAGSLIRWEARSSYYCGYSSSTVSWTNRSTLAYNTTRVTANTAYTYKIRCVWTNAYYYLNDTLLSTFTLNRQGNYIGLLWDWWWWYSYVDNITIKKI